MESRRAILTYHSLDDSGSVISVAPHLFYRQMEALAASGVTVTRLEDLLATPPPAVALTFDDGFQNFAVVAAPVLARLEFPATVFLVSGHCGGSNDWPSQRPGVPRLPLLDWDAVRELGRAGFDFGAHTVTHPDLARLADAEARHEVLSSQKQIEDATGRSVECFAYPYGTMPDAVRRLVAEQFVAGCSTRLAFVTAASQPEALERLDAYYLSSAYCLRRLFGLPAQAYLALRGALRVLNTRGRSYD